MTFLRIRCRALEPRNWAHPGCTSRVRPYSSAILSWPRIGVEKSASHHLSQNEIGGGNPCSPHPTWKANFRDGLALMFEGLRFRIAGVAIQHREVCDSRKRRKGWIVDYFPARIANTIRINPSKNPPGTMVISPRGSA